MRHVFLGFDENGDGQIDRTELKKALQEMGQKMSRRQVRRVMSSVDKDGSGLLDYEEFIQAVLGAH
jgi:centrin-1